MHRATWRLTSLHLGGLSPPSLHADPSYPRRAAGLPEPVIRLVRAAMRSWSSPAANCSAASGVAGSVGYHGVQMGVYGNFSRSQQYFLLFSIGYSFAQHERITRTAIVRCRNTNGRPRLPTPPRGQNGDAGNRGQAGKSGNCGDKTGTLTVPNKAMR